MSEESQFSEMRGDPTPSPLREIVQPFIDLVHAPRALWGVNIAYFLEGLVYFGWLTLLMLFGTNSIGLNDIHASWLAGGLTWGITLSMVFLGSLGDKWGARRAIAIGLFMMLVGRIVMAGGLRVFAEGEGLGSPLFFSAAAGLLAVVIGYGLFQPAAYAAVRQFTTERTAPMGYAMLYALMNLGAFVSGLLSPRIRGVTGVGGVFTVYVGITAFALITFLLVLTRRVQREALEEARDEREVKLELVPPPPPEAPSRDLGERIIHWIKNHPLANVKFTFFIFCLIPVQTLFAYNWLILPPYISRALGPFAADNMETFSNLNPLLIFVLTPIVTALTTRRNVYNMMILGTFVMAAPTFLLTISPNLGLLLAFLLISSVGEALWQPRFLQYAAEIAPPGRTAAYMGIAQLPWFLTKFIVPFYSGWFLMKFCPETGTQRTEFMWLVFACIAMLSTVFLLVARGWAGKDFKTHA